MEKISFIIPVYNAAKYLSVCLESVRQQKGLWEAVLIDDGSRDGSDVICDEYVRKDHRFQVIHTDNHGVASARLKGFAQATGTYVSFIDSDDWLEPEFLSIIAEKQATYESDVIIVKKADSDKRAEETKNYFYEPGCYNRQELRKKIYPTLLANPTCAVSEITGSLWGKVFRRNLLEDNIQYIDTTLFMGEDQVWLWPTLLQAEKITFCAELLYNYRREEGQATQRYHADLHCNYSKVIAILRRVNREKKEYSKYDFSAQIDLMQAEFTINIIDNEFFFHANGWRNAYRIIKNLSRNRETHEILKNISYHTFGKRGLWLFLLQRKWNIILVLMQSLNRKLRRG